MDLSDERVLEGFVDKIRQGSWTQSTNQERLLAALNPGTSNIRDWNCIMGVQALPLFCGVKMSPSPIEASLKKNECNDASGKKLSTKQAEAPETKIILVTGDGTDMTTRQLKMKECEPLVFKVEPIPEQPLCASKQSGALAHKLSEVARKIRVYFGSDEDDNPPEPMDLKVDPECTILMVIGLVLEKAKRIRPELEKSHLESDDPRNYGFYLYGLDSRMGNFSSIRGFAEIDSVGEFAIIQDDKKKNEKSNTKLGNQLVVKLGKSTIKLAKELTMVTLWDVLACVERQNPKALQHGRSYMFELDPEVADRHQWPKDARELPMEMHLTVLNSLGCRILVLKQRELKDSAGLVQARPRPASPQSSRMGRGSTNMTSNATSASMGAEEHGRDSTPKHDGEDGRETFKAMVELYKAQYTDQTGYTKQEWEVHKVNQYRKEQRRMIGVDDVYIYNSKRAGAESSFLDYIVGREKVRRKKREVSSIKKVDFGLKDNNESEDASKDLSSSSDMRTTDGHHQVQDGLTKAHRAFFIEYKKGPNRHVQYYAKNQNEAAQIIAKIEWVMREGYASRSHSSNPRTNGRSSSIASPSDESSQSRYSQ